MDSQFGIAHVWTQGDFVTRAVAIILLAMSVASWLVMIIKALDIVKFKKLARNAQDFWHSPDLASGLEKLDRKSTRLNSSHLVISYAVFCLKKKIDLALVCLL